MLDYYLYIMQEAWDRAERNEQNDLSCFLDELPDAYQNKDGDSVDCDVWFDDYL